MLLHGPNGSGKTNLLESLHVGTQGFSPRARSDAQMVRFGEDAGRVALRGVSGRTPFETTVALATRGARSARLNGERLASPEWLRRELTTLVFTPDRLAVVKGPPATRRAYFDRALGRLLPAKASLPVEYAAAVGQRNAALRRLRAGVSTRSALRPWTVRVVSLGTELVISRAAATSLLGGPFTRIARELGLESATVEYAGDGPTEEALDARLALDVDRGLTGVGPHLHDVRVEAGGRDVRSFGSQGEQRVAVLALVLAEWEVLLERTGFAPLLLLDDVLSELDDDRRLALAGIVSRCGQTVVTATAAASFPGEPAQKLAVSPGKAA